jgi:hypothetical protein
MGQLSSELEILRAENYATISNEKKTCQILYLSRGVFMETDREQER